MSIKKFFRVLLTFIIVFSLVSCARSENSVGEKNDLPFEEQQNEKLKKYTDNSYFCIKESINTEYGYVLYVLVKGGPHGSSPILTFISSDGEEIIINSDVVYSGPFSLLPCNDILLSMDGKKIEFNVRLEALEENSINDPGTYYYSFDLCARTLALDCYRPF